jgi:hypothetical protein
MPPGDDSFTVRRRDMFSPIAATASVISSSTVRFDPG